MRFLADGPHIPDDLLEARDRGEVVFLCGAGVSRPAGMPGFLELARDVVQELKTQSSAPSLELLSLWEREDIPEAARPSLDQIFERLQIEYGPDEIELQIARRLMTNRGSNDSTHKTVLRLSRGTEGKPQVVTTNFDHLFEFEDEAIRLFFPPDLPSLSYGRELNGLVYLHGRVQDEINNGGDSQGLVVSSSDFGQAYLAEGWATRFILELLDRYTVVLLGYSASDPPVKYLLQGLRKSRLTKGARIYAFDAGAEHEVLARWDDSAVTALAYQKTQGHSALWNSLEAWAARADDPRAWQKEVVGLAQEGPRGLERHERGQVASIVRTVDGARLFAEADPPPPSEWLCVFDRAVRFGKIERDPYGALPDFDPLAEYGLDDDPQRPEGNVSGPRDSGDHLLSLRIEDKHEAKLDLAETLSQEQMDLPGRLTQLVRWIVKVSDEPVVPWWAAKHTRLHPLLLRKIDSNIRLNPDQYPPLARSTWALLFEKFENQPSDELRGSLLAFKELVAVEGWTYRVLAQLERGLAPYLTTESFPVVRPRRPPLGDWDKLNVSEIADFRLRFPFVREISFDIPDEVLPSVYIIGRRQLERVIGLLGVAGRARERMRIFASNTVGVVRGENPNALVEWFRDIIGRMVETRPGFVRADLALWPDGDLFFFHGLRMYVWSLNAFFEGNEVGDELLSLPDNAFWDDYHMRQLMHLLVERWQSFTQGQRRGIEKRLARGRGRFAFESDDEYERRRLIQSGRILLWLVSRGCELGSPGKATVESFREIDPDWSPDLEGDSEDDGEGRWVTTDPDPTVLLDVAISEIVPLALDQTTLSYAEGTDYEPFVGLVRERPERALGALKYQANREDFPLNLWKTALMEWPNEAHPRDTWLFGAMITLLPKSAVFDLRSELFGWLKQHLSKIATEDQERALSIFDVTLDKLLGRGEAATQSGIAERVAGDSIGWSRKTLLHAINSPVGLATWVLLDLLRLHDSAGDSGIPSEFKGRLEKLLRAPGEGADHAVSAIALRLEWLHYLDPEWVRVLLVPWFSRGNPFSEPAWNGVLHGRSLRKPAVFSLLRMHFLNVFVSANEWKWGDEGLEVLHKFIVLGCLWRKYDRVYLTFSEAHRVLKETSDSGRLQTLRFLSDLLADDANEVDWHGFGERFLDEAWPREVRFQTEGTSLLLAEIAGFARESFPEAVQSILPRLVPITKDSWFLLRVVSRAGEKREFEVATDFPEATLNLMIGLVPGKPSENLFDLNNILERIAEANPTLRQDSRWKRLKRIALQT